VTATRNVEVVSFSSTLLFHMIPAVTETLIRWPTAAPLFAFPDAPELRSIYAALVVVFSIGLALEIRWLRASPRQQEMAHESTPAV
jgi:hypothetical protein